MIKYRQIKNIFISFLWERSPSWSTKKKIVLAVTTIRMKSIIAAVVTTILTRTNTRTNIIMNTANAAVTKRNIRRTITQATKIFCTTKKICPTS